MVLLEEREIVQEKEVWDLKPLRLLGSTVNPSNLLHNPIGNILQHSIQKGNQEISKDRHTLVVDPIMVNMTIGDTITMEIDHPPHHGYPQNQGNRNRGYQGNNYQARGNQSGGALYYRGPQQGGQIPQGYQYRKNKERGTSGCRHFNKL